MVWLSSYFMDNCIDKNEKNPDVWYNYHLLNADIFKLNTSESHLLLTLLIQGEKYNLTILIAIKQNINY